MAFVTSLELGRTMEKKLHSVGIYSAEKLKDVGSRARRQYRRRFRRFNFSQEI